MFNRIEFKKWPDDFGAYCNISKLVGGPPVLTEEVSYSAALEHGKRSSTVHFM